MSIRPENAETQSIETGEDTFSIWLSSTKRTFRNLTEAQRTEALKGLLEECSSEQLCYLTQVYLPNVCQVDFITLLPREVALKILRYLDGETLKLCTQVCKSWLEVLCSADLWLHMFWKEGGVRKRGHFTTKKAFSMWKEQNELRLRLCEESALVQVNFRPGGDVNYSVKCMHYRHPWIATCSEDRTVYLWDTVKDHHVKAIEAHSVCQVSFDDEFLYTASYDNTAASWVIQTGRLHCRYIGHFNGVLSIDAWKKKQLIITGSADSTIKLWHLHDGQLLESFTGFHSGWIKQVKFLLTGENGVEIEESKGVEQLVAVLSSDAKGKIVVWTISVYEVDDETIVVEKFKKVYEHINCLNQPVLTTFNQICISGRVSKSNSRTPVLLFFDLNVDHHVEHGETLTLSLGKEVILPELLPNNGKLIGAGKRFAVFHLTEEMGLSTCSYICILDMEMDDFFSNVQVPHESRYGEPPCLGDTQWLDGFTGHSDQLFLGIVQPQNFAVTLYYTNKQRKKIGEQV